MISSGIYNSDASYHPFSAIVLYKGNGSEYLATRHGIIGNELGPGTPIDLNFLETVFKSDSNTSDYMRMLPGELLAVSPDSVLWYRKAKRNPIFFKIVNGNDTLNDLNGTDIIWPNLIFKYSGGSLHVWAYVSNKRPTSNTDLYIPPFLNIHSGGSVCMPPAFKAEKLTCQNHDAVIQVCEKHFFNSAFSHSNSFGKIVNYRGGHSAFWNSYCKKFRKPAPPHRFPNEVLIPAQMKLERLLK